MVLWLCWTTSLPRTPQVGAARLHWLALHWCSKSDPFVPLTEVMQVKKYGALVLAKGNMAEWAFSNAISIGSGKRDPAVPSSCL